MSTQKSVLSFSCEQLSLSAAMLFISYTVIREVFAFSGVDVNITGIIIIIIEYGLLGLSLFLKKPSSFRFSFVFLFIITVFLIFSQLIHPEYGNIMAKGLSLQRGVIVILFLCGLSSEDNLVKCISWSGYCSVLNVLFAMIQYFSNGGYWTSTLNGNTRYSSYNMDIGYNAAFAVIILFTEYLKDKKTYKLIISVLLFFISLVFGSRGCLLVYAFYGIFVLFNTERSKKKTIVILLLSFILLIAFLVGFENILLFTANNLEKIGLKSRTLNSLLDTLSLSTGVNTSGRDEMWNMLIEKIWDKPILGYGVFGDQFIFSSVYGISYFAHNIILELFISFGIPIGLVMICLLVHYCKKTNRKLKGSNIGLYFGALISYNLGNLMFSNTYWYSTSFWMLIAVIIWASYREIEHGKDSVEWRE